MDKAILRKIIAGDKTYMDKGERWRKFLPSKWQCDYIHCLHGMGLAGLDRCPGNPCLKDCPEWADSEIANDEERWNKYWANR